LKVFLDKPEIQARIRDIGARADYGSPAQFAAFIQGEIDKFGGIIRKENLQMDVN
jgi:tripartite-type tricarboxylate transporter receptor subunit TctC